LQHATTPTKHLDGLRIVAACAVVVLHYSDYFKDQPAGRFMVDPHLALQPVRGLFNPARYPLSDLPAQLLLLHAFDGERLAFNFPSWSLSAEMFCYVLFPAVAVIAARRKALIVALFVLPALANSLYAEFAGTMPRADWINKGGRFQRAARL